MSRQTICEFSTKYSKINKGASLLQCQCISVDYLGETYNFKFLGVRQGFKVHIFKEAIHFHSNP